MEKGKTRSVARLLLALGYWTIPAAATGITYTCNSNINTLSGTNACATLNSSIASAYGSTFSDANATIFIQFANNHGLGESNQFVNTVTYTQYRNALISHEGDANDVTAVSTLPAVEPAIFGSGSISITTALAGALGFNTLTAGIENDGTTFCSTPGVGNCYDGVITLNDPTDLANQTGGQDYYYRSGSQSANEYDFFSIAEHETDEILGTGSCIGTSGGSPFDECGGGKVEPADLFRYSGSGTRTFVAGGDGGPAYFSINGGASVIENFNNSPNGQDYGDWSTNCRHVQDATGCLGQSLDLINDGGVEITVLDAVGYNPAPPPGVPEPGTLDSLVAPLCVLALARRRQRLP
jgi:hypothetical protein